MKQKLMGIVLFVTITFSVVAQTVVELETNLNQLFVQLYEQTQDSAKCLLSDQIADQLQVLTSIESGMGEKLANVPYLKVLQSSDQTLNYYSWSYPLQYYFQFAGLILTKDGDAYELSNVSAPFLPDVNKEYTQTNWYGAIYYDMVTYTYKKQTVYLMLGWSKYCSETQIKLIDVLKVKNGQVSFGQEIFEIDEDQYQSRYILDYDSEVIANILSEGKNKIVFDHLAPLKQVNIYSEETTTLGPDMSFDAFVKKGKSWILKKDIRGKNKKQ